MLKPSLLLSALLLTVSATQAQTSTSPATPTASAPSAAATALPNPAKKELVSRILKVQQPDIEAMARTMAEQPAAEILERAGAALPQRVAADKREAVAKGIQDDVKKYVDQAVPLVRDRAVKLAPSTIGALLEEKFTEDELRQLLTIMESATWNKFLQLGGEMQQSLQQKLVLETRSSIEPKVKALEQTVARRLGIDAPTQGSTTSGAKTPAAKTAKPAASR